ncbi:MAG: hypothetical protein HYU86_00355 [Chloroflexi bacterium]|nr:hypothetical protein [Chloroflexota bacterium]
MTYDNLQQVMGTFEQKAGEISSRQAWIFKARQQNAVIQLLVKLDRIVSDMPYTEKEKLAKRFSNIIPKSATQFRREYDDQFLEALVEVLGWGWLRDKYPSQEVRFSEPPDLIVQDDTGQVVAAMACKKIRTSDEDRDYFKSHQGEVRTVNMRLISSNIGENPLLRKVKNTLHKGEEQLSKVEASSKFIFIDFSWDVSAWIQNEQDEQVKGLIKGLAAELQKRGILLVAFEQFQSCKSFTGA